MNIPFKIKLFHFDEISPKAFTLTRSQGWHRKKLFNLPRVSNKCWTLWPCIGPKAEKKRIPSNLGGQFATLGANVPAFINNWGQFETLGVNVPAFINNWGQFETLGANVPAFINNWGQFENLGANVPAFIINWGQFAIQKLLKIGPKYFWAWLLV